MIQPEIQVDTSEWNEIKPVDYTKIADPIQMYPDLMTFLKNNPWRLMSGHSCVPSYMDKFKENLNDRPELIRCIIQAPRNFVKLILLTPPECSHIQLADCLMVKVPFVKEKTKRTVSAETFQKPPKPLLTPEVLLKDFAGHDGSLINHLGNTDDEIETEFEIEETTSMVQEWISKGWYVPPPRPKPMYQAPDRPIKKKPKKKVTFNNKPRYCNKRWPSQSKKNQETQTQTWKEILQSELESDHFNDQLFNTTDTDHDSEDTVIEN